jgi:hypothetical protein
MIFEMVHEINSLRRQIFYCYEQIKQSNEEWERKEYQAVIDERRQEIRRLRDNLTALISMVNFPN